MKYPTELYRNIEQETYSIKIYVASSKVSCKPTRHDSNSSTNFESQKSIPGNYHFKIERHNNKSYVRWSRALEVIIDGHSLRLARWLWVTSILSLFALFMKLHEVHPLLLIIAIITQIAMLGYRIQSKVVSEKLLVVSGLGAQSTLTFLTGKCLTRFIPWGHLIDIIIAETITMQQVLFFMAILIKSKESGSSEELYPLFLHTWPKLYCLQEIYRYCQEILRPKRENFDPTLLQ